jgi:hypothetical protein
LNFNAGRDFGDVVLVEKVVFVIVGEKHFSTTQPHDMMRFIKGEQGFIGIFFFPSLEVVFKVAQHFVACETTNWKHLFFYFVGFSDSSSHAVKSIFGKKIIFNILKRRV